MSRSRESSRLRLDVTGRKGTTVVRGEGSIYRRTSDNRWVAQIEAGRGTNGRRRHARAVRPTRKEAHAALKELHRTVDAGATPGQASTVATFMAWWLDNVLPGQVTADSITKYRLPRADAGRNTNIC